MKQMLVSFDSLGFEAIIDYSELLGKAMMAKLAGGAPALSPIPFMKTRAMANPQRFPEIWVVNLDDSLTVENFRVYCENDPQGAANLIRENGECIFKTPRQQTIIV